MNKTLIQIITLLRHDHYINGDVIGKALNMTRAGVWKNIHKLQRDYHIPIDTQKGKGYRLKTPLVLLNQHKIAKALSQHDLYLECFNSIDSTNRWLKTQPYHAKYHICLAEHQSTGKGRFNRVWLSPFGQNIYLSLKSVLAKDSSELAGLSLSIGVIIVKSLVSLYPEISPLIKWPNDIYLDGKKLAGILIEVKAESNDKSELIIGIGLNVNMTEAICLDNAWTSLASSCQKSFDREPLVIRLIENLLTGLECFEKSGFRAFQEDYQRCDFLQGKSVTLTLPNDVHIAGVYQGISQLGQLIINHAGKNRAFASGEVQIKNR